MRRALAVASLLAALAAAGSGCGFGAGEHAGERGLADRHARLRHRARSAASGSASVSESDTVMRLLQRDFEVETRYGGNFVQEIDGVAGGREGGRRVDWFYYVNGIEASNGAAERRVAAGRPDLVGPPRLERHDARPGGGRLVPRAVRVRQRGAQAARADRVPRRGRRGLRRGRDAAGRRGRHRHGSLGARAVRRARGAAGARRAVVGGAPRHRRAQARGRARGVGRVRAADAGRATGSTCSTQRGRVVRTLGSGGGLLAATRIEAQQPTWVVTGVDAAGVAASAAALAEHELARPLRDRRSRRAARCRCP